MSLSERIATDLLLAQKEGNKVRLETLRMLKSELKYRQIQKGSPLTEEEEIEVLSSSVKKRRESIEQFRNGNRPELVANEEAQLIHVQAYLPQQLGQLEIESLIDVAVAEVEAKGKSDLGKVMKALMPKLKGRADGKLVNQLVGAKLEKLAAG